MAGCHGDRASSGIGAATARCWRAGLDRGPRRSAGRPARRGARSCLPTPCLRRSPLTSPTPRAPRPCGRDLGGLRPDRRRHQQCRDPASPAGHTFEDGRGPRAMAVNYFSPWPSPSPHPENGRARLGRARQRLEPGAARGSTESPTAARSSPSPLERERSGRSHRHGVTVRLVLPAPSTRRSGPARQRRPLYDDPSAPRGGGRGIIAAIDSERFEHYVLT